MDIPQDPPSLLPEAYDTPEELAEAVQRLREQLEASHVPEQGHGTEETHDVLYNISEACIRGHAPTFFPFVIGGVTPVAAVADGYVTRIDANPSAPLPDVSIACDVEDTALRWLLEMFRFDPNEWKHRIFTTGATGSNILGIACGRDWVVQEAARRRNMDSFTVGDLGVFEAFTRLQIKGIQVLSTMPHSSTVKAASIVGIGRSSVVSVVKPGASLDMDLEKLETELSRSDVLNIVAVSAGEVNTGLFATTGAEMQAISSLCKKYGAWLHVDGAFGLNARLLQKGSGFDQLVDGVAGIELADSITGDAHKLLNVPYDCGYFFSKHPDVAMDVFQNAGAAYLKTPPGGIITPLNVSLENSRRFRGLPVYASLHAYGIAGFVDMLIRQITAARGMAKFIEAHANYELLPGGVKIDQLYMIVIFRAKDPKLNETLIKRINKSGLMYVSGTSWEGKPATRISVSNWQVSQKEVEVVEKVLQKVVEDFKAGA